MERSSHLNLKWSVADTDAILSMAARGISADQIARGFNKSGKNTSGREIADLCANAGVPVRRFEFRRGV